MEKQLRDLQVILSVLEKAISSKSEEEWDNIIAKMMAQPENNNLNPIQIEVCYGIIFDGEKNYGTSIRYLLQTYDNGNLKVTIDASTNHNRPHLHIGYKKNYHSVSIALDDGSILENSGDIDNWKINKISEWVIHNQKLLIKIWRTIVLWGDKVSADKRNIKLSKI